MKHLSFLFKTLISLFILLNAVILLSGKLHVYKAIKIGYLRGHNTATIEDLNFFDTRIIAAGKPDQWAKSTNYNKKSLEPEFRSRLEKNKSIALIVIQNDSIDYEEYWGIGSRSSRTNSFSVGKSIVSILIGIAIDEGYIESVDQKVIDFIPEYNDEGKHFNNELTIKHLLTMSAGLKWDEGYYNPFGVTAESYFTKNIDDLMLQVNCTNKPGEAWSYQSGSTQLLGMVLSRATGTTISDYTSEKLWKPMGATDDAEWMIDKEGGMEKAFCCFNTNALDFARFGKLYLNQGNWKGQQLVDSAYVKHSLTPSLSKYYGYSWWIYNERHKYPVFCMRGVNGQYIINIPELNLVAVRLGHKIEKYENNSASDLDFYIQEIIKQYDDSMDS